MLGEEFGHLGLDRLGQPGARSVAQHLGKRVGERPWLKQLDDVSIGHGVSLLCWRSGGSNTPTIRRLLPVRPSPTFALSSGLRQDGITAPFVIDRAMTRAIFTEYLRQCLVPTLAPGDIVVMDNLPAHKGGAVRQIIEAAGAELRYLPASSPDLNPIEQPIAKLKAHLRKAQERSIDTLWQR